MCSKNAVGEDCNAPTDAEDTGAEYKSSKCIRQNRNLLFIYFIYLFYFYFILVRGLREFGRAGPNAVGEDRNASTDAMTREQNTGPQNAFEKTSFCYTCYNFQLAPNFSHLCPQTLSLLPYERGKQHADSGFFGFWVFIRFLIFH